MGQLLKYKLKSFSKLYSKEKRRRDNVNFGIYTINYRRGYLRIDKVIDVEYETVLQLETDLKEYEKHQCNGAILRSKAFWALQSDRNTAYFLKREKYRLKFNCVKELYTTTGNLVSNTMAILETEVELYRKLYSSEPVDFNEQEQLFENIDKRIDVDGKNLCDKDITLQDLTETYNVKK